MNEIALLESSSRDDDDDGGEGKVLRSCSAWCDIHHP